MTGLVGEVSLNLLGTRLWLFTVMDEALSVMYGVNRSYTAGQVTQDVQVDAYAVAQQRINMVFLVLTVIDKVGDTPVDILRNMNVMHDRVLGDRSWSVTEKQIFRDAYNLLTE